MTPQEYYKSTRTIETQNWTLNMALNFAEEYAEALQKEKLESIALLPVYGSHNNRYSIIENNQVKLYKNQLEILKAIQNLKL